MLAFLAALGKGLIGFIKTPLGRAVGTFLIVVLILAAVYDAGRKKGEADAQAAHSAEQAAVTETVKKIEEKSDKISEAVAEKHDKAVTEIRWRTKYLTKEVPIYVTEKDDAGCVVPDGFVSLYNAAAEGSDPEVPGPPGGPDGPGSGVALSTVAEIDVYNLGVAQYLRTEVLTWREWYAAQAAAYGTAATPAR